MITPIIMAGGSGTRLWPLSRTKFPKQFLKLTSKHSLLQETLLRLGNLTTHTPLIICNQACRFIAKEQVQEIGLKANILLEPFGRNTAPAIALAAHSLLRKDKEDPLLLVMSADHHIESSAAFVEAVINATNIACDNKLVTLGIMPTCPHTGYGYIKRGAAFHQGYHIDKFVEKPNKEMAIDYLQTKQYFWNSGIFLFKASVYIQQLEKYQPDIAKICLAASQNLSQQYEFEAINQDIFAKCPNESIDYAVMEKTSDALMVPMDAGWSDVGTWSALSDLKSADEQANISDNENAVFVNSKNCFVHSDDRLVSLIGLNDIMVIDTKDALLVTTKDQADQVKNVVAQLKQKNCAEHEQHREVHRPWGKFDSISKGDRFQVKKITVNPGAKLSLQMHHHRAEHWIVVSGTAKITKGKETFFLTENESTFIPVGITHSIENPGSIILEIIEVQSGAYLGEDDIVRFEDEYGRLTSA